jgi:conjugative transfer region protein TrbK
MGSHLTSRRFVWVGAIFFVVLTAAVAMIRSGRDEDPAVFAPLPSREDVFADDLARCRTITPDDTAGLDACCRAWAENRQRFSTRKLPLLSNPSAPHAPGKPMKNLDQVPPHDVEQGRIR